MTVYRVSTLNGKFDHVKSHATAIKRAREMVGADETVSADELTREWGVKIVPVSKSVARSVGIYE